MQTYEPFITAIQAADSALAQRHAAFAELVRRFGGMAFGYAYQLLGNEQLAQDATQEAFLTAYQRMAQLREPAAFPGWLRRIVHTQCHRFTRAKRPDSVSLEQIADATSADDLAQRVADEDAARALVDCVMQAVAALPEHERTVVRLFYLEGYSIGEAAQALNLPVTTIKKRLQYARQRLRNHLLERFKNGGAPPGWTLHTVGMQIAQWLLPLFSMAAAEPVLCPVYVTVARGLR